eukprot:SAG22_NODE_1022_length_5991_cov_3.875424_8_plen_44_part_00
MSVLSVEIQLWKEVLLYCNEYFCSSFGLLGRKPAVARSNTVSS